MGEIPDVHPEAVAPFTESPALQTKDVSGLGDITNVHPGDVTPFPESPSMQYANIANITQRHIISTEINFNL